MRIMIKRDDIVNGIAESMRKTDMRLRVAAHFHFRNHVDFLHFLPDMGLWKLSVKRAGEMWANDVLHPDGPDDLQENSESDSVSEDTKRNDDIQAKSDVYCQKLLRAIERGEIIAVYTKKDFDSNFVLEKTYIDYNDLTTWLRDRDYNPGYYFDEYESEEVIISQYAHLKIAYAREMYTRGLLDNIKEPFYMKELSQDITEDMSKEKIVLAWKREIAKNLLLIERTKGLSASRQSDVDRPLPTRSRNTMLVVIAALCAKSGIDFQARGAASRIVEAVERLGATLTDDTIKKMLDEIPEAIEVRTK